MFFDMIHIMFDDKIGLNGAVWGSTLITFKKLEWSISFSSDKVIFSLYYYSRYSM